MNFHLETVFSPDFRVVPGVNYRGTGFGYFCEYLGDRYQGTPWKYGWERCAVPAMTMSQGTVDGRIVSASLFAEPNDNSCCSIYQEKQHCVQEIQWPEEESPVMDSFAICYAADLYELYQLTGNSEWKERSEAIWKNGCQHVSDGCIALNGAAPRPCGSQDEYYETTRQSLSGKQQSRPGTASEWLVAWPCAFRLDYIRRMRNEQ